MAKFRRFPCVVAEIIADYAITPKLSIPIPAGPIMREYGLYANPMAMEAGLLDYADLGNYKIVMNLSINPAAMHIIRANTKLFLESNDSHNGLMWYNSAAIGWLLENDQRINWSALSGNKSPWAIKKLSENITMVDWRILSRNPAAAPLLLLHRDKVDKITVLSNPLLYDMFDGYGRITSLQEWDALSRNPHPQVVKRMCDNWDRIPLEHFARNPGIFSSERDRRLMELLCYPI